MNGREQRYSSAATALAYVIMGRLMEYDLWRGRESSDLTPDLLGDDQMPSSEWSVVRSALRSMLDESQEFGTLELAEISLDGDLDSTLRAVACLLASIGYADMEMYTDAVATCERLLEQQANLPILPRVMIQLHACMRNAEIKDFRKALYWGNSARSLLEVLNSSSAAEQKIVDGLRFSAEINVISLNDAASDKVSFSASKWPTLPALWLELNATSGSAAMEYLAEDYKHRIRDRVLRRPPRSYQNEDYISRNMYAYYVRTQLMGDWQMYLQASRRLGMERMLRPVGDSQSSHGCLSQGLVYLRKGWASGQYKEALRLVREEGPLQALDSELQKALMRLQQYGVTDLEFHVLQAGAPLLRAEEANSVCRSLLETPLPRRARRAQGWYLTQVPMWDAVAALSREMSDVDYLSQQMRERIQDADSTEAINMDKAAEALNWASVSDPEQGRWVSTVLSTYSRNDDWRSLLDTVLYKLCDIGNVGALDFLGQMSSSDMTLARSAQIVSLPEAVGGDLLAGSAGAIADLCVSVIGSTRSSAARGAWSFGGHNAAAIGTLLSIRRPEQQIWSVLVDFLRDTSIAASDKDPVLDVFAFHVDDIPAEVVQRVSSDPERLTSIQPGLFWPSAKNSGPVLRFLCAAEAISESEALSVLMLLSGAEEPSDRIEASKSLPLLGKVIGNSLASGYLLHMTMDPSVLVRMQSAEMLGHFLGCANVNSRLVSQRLIQMLGSDGVAVPFGALRGLRLAKENAGVFAQPEIVDTLHKIARDHAMVRVRQAAKSLLT
ncbi:hypothetical protein [Streptomyces sp. NPDC006289]|uniref:hypothetical protein n=1 Tax=Streptomyces sp. NPDC006289 TaxID=3156744 RepID=UPI0033BCC1F2